MSAEGAHAQAAVVAAPRVQSASVLRKYWIRGQLTPLRGLRRRSDLSDPAIGSAGASGCAPDRCRVACITSMSWRPRRRDRVIAEHRCDRAACR
jgi:hypothetical protein